MENCLNPEKILFKVNRIKSISTSMLSNCYSNSYFEHADSLYETDGSFAFLYNDNGVLRLVYFAKDNKALQSLLKQVEKECVVSFLTKDPDEHRKDIEESGFKQLARMRRMSTTNISSGLTNPVITPYKDMIRSVLATSEDTEKISALLTQVFDTRISRLPSKEQLLKDIADGDISLYKNESGDIRALVYCIIQPKKFYVNQYYNGAHTGVIHAILLNLFEEYVKNGGEYVYCWIDENNVASNKCMAKYGMTHDGMWEVLYVRD